MKLNISVPFENKWENDRIEKLPIFIENYRENEMNLIKFVFSFIYISEIFRSDRGKNDGGKKIVMYIHIRISSRKKTKEQEKKTNQYFS